MLSRFRFLRLSVPWLRACASALLIGAALAAIFWVCTFKIMDRDFWWHITAGKLLLTSGWIAVDPFAYTREGLPYLATHEWLAQIVLSLIYQTFGSTGIILFRGVIASLSVGLLLLIAPRRIFPNILLAVWGVVIAKGSFLERPQLFTFVIVAAFLLLSFGWLDARTLKKRAWIGAAFLALQLLWVNTHGGAAVVGCAMVTFLLLQGAVTWWRSRQPEEARGLLLLCGTLALMAVILVLPPNGLGTVAYLWNLLSDQTIVYIAEWQPRAWPLYLSELWPFWLAAVGSLLLGRRHLLFNTLLLVMTAALSRQAFRHEILFIFAALATCFYQLKQAPAAERAWSWLARRRLTASALTLVLVLVLGRVAVVRSFDFEQRDNLFGFGQFDLARGAYEFLEREGVKGKMFNTYGIGGYIIHRGFPERKVFIDGRNVDYGMDFMTLTYAAGVNEQRWQELTERYGVTYALVDYDAIRERDRLPYSWHLDRNPDWPLVYLDDWVAVYLKNTPENKPVIDRSRYTLLTATDLQFKSDFAHVSQEDHDVLVRELERVRRENMDGVKATLALANLALQEGRFDEVTALAEDASRVRPFSPEPYAVLGAAAVARRQWDEAADAYDHLLRLAGSQYPDVNRDYIAGVFDKAGRAWRAWFMRLGSTAPMMLPSVGTGAVVPEPKGGLPNPALDAQQFNDEGVEQAQQREYAEAERLFQTATMLNPSFAEAWNNLCALLVGQKRMPEAIDACRRAIEIAPEFADAHFNLALAYYHQGSLKESETQALEAKRLGRAEESDALLLLLGKKKTR